MRSDNKIPPIGTIINDRKYIGGLEIKYSGGHKRNFITVKCMKCGLERHIEAKCFLNHGCKCNQLASIKSKHGFQARDNKELHRFYNIYCGIKTRCKGTAGGDTNKWYHDKGIKNEWPSFEDFKNDMYESYIDHVNKHGIKNTSIDRIDPNGNYCKNNCRWATVDEQNFNKSTTNYVMIDGVKYDGKMLAEKCGITKVTACGRISKYLHGDIPYSNLILEGNHSKDKLQAVIDGKPYYSKDIQQITGINGRNARGRLRDYIDGKITKEKLFTYKSR